MAALCLGASLLLLQRTVRNLTSPAAALITLAIAVCWLALLPHDDYVHYSSELVPGLLLVGAAALITHPDSGRGYWRLWLSGLILGVIPWTKLQAIPIGAALGLWALWRVNWEDEEGSRRWVKVLSLIGAALLPTIVMLFWIGGAGAWHDFRQSYLIANLSYAGSKPLAHMLRDMGALLFLHPITFTWFLTVACLALLAGVIPGRPFEGVSLRSFCFAMVWLAAAMFAIVKPVTQFGHYQLFIVFPLGVLGGLLVQPVVRFPVPVRWKAAILGLCLVPALGILGPSVFKTHWAALSKRSDATPMVSDQQWLLERFRAHAPHARSLAIWGWAPSLYVETGIPPATRHAIHHFLHAPHQARAFLRASFLRDLQAELPDAIVLIDILHLHPLLGPSETIDKAFPELARILQENYHINQGEQRGEIGMWVCTRKRTS
jgi:hypothetical protein